MTAEGPRPRPAYRPDIDGLRALAVAAVVLYHAGIPGFGGGYVGVDVFFVISGFLITQLLAGRDQVPFKIPLTEFYVRRARRILPGLLATSLLTALAAVALLMPWDLERFGKYLAATSVLSSNLPAWTEAADYFDSRMTYSPLTHFWSIAVEEQFYLLYPLILIAIAKWVPRARSAALLVMAALSLGVCVWASYHRPIGNFFLAPTRAWELLLGAALALTGAQFRWNRVAAELAAFLGVLILIATVFGYAPTMRYPGLYTLAPCAASALVLVAGAQAPTLTHRLLARRALVFTGLISFSLYLWHLPILLLFDYYHITPVGAIGTAALLASIYLAAALSWKFVETPVRNRSFLRSNRTFVTSMIAIDAAALIVGIWLWHSDGLPERFPAALGVLDENWMASSGSVLQCVRISLEKIRAGDLCSYGPQSDTAPKALVWGDSHAMALLGAYRQLADSHGVRVYFAVKAACKPLLGATNPADAPIRQAGCADFNAAVLRAIRRLKPQVVILNAHWIDTESIGVSDANTIPADGRSNFRRVLEYTARTVATKPGAVCGVLDVPIMKYSVPYAVGMARRRGISEDFLRLDRQEALRQFHAPEQDFLALKESGLMRTVDLKDSICAESVCKYEDHGALLYSDRDHLSIEGAHFVSRTIEGCFPDL